MHSVCTCIHTHMVYLMYIYICICNTYKYVSINKYHMHSIQSMILLNSCCLFVLLLAEGGSRQMTSVSEDALLSPSRELWFHAFVIGRH